LIFVVSLLSTSSRAATIVDFEDLMLAADTAVTADGSAAPFESRGVVFNADWNQEFDCCPSGFAYSNKVDITTAGFDNPFSAVSLTAPGGVEASANYGVGNNLRRGESIITLPQPSLVEGVFVTNTTYGYLAVLNGDDAGAGFVKGPFGADDWFRLDFIGIDADGAETGTVEFYLADFRNGESTVVDAWTWVDLTSLGDNVNTIEFEMASTDTGVFGMNTPAYFGIDNLTIAVPEPGSLMLGLISILVFCWYRSNASDG